MRMQTFTKLFLIVVVSGLMGCSKERARTASMLAPNAQAGRGVSADPDGARRIELPFDSLNFVGGVQNPYFPLVPGAVYSYVQETPEGTETNRVEVTHDTKVILGVTNFVVHDQVFLEGVPTEDTYRIMAAVRSS